jgi:hypothetical protein
MQDDQDRPRLDEIEKQRKEDYKAYHERDIDEGWPYADDAATETDRLNGNRPYHDEDLAPVEPGVLGMQVEEAPLDDDVELASGELGDEDDVAIDLDEDDDLEQR